MNIPLITVSLRGSASRHVSACTVGTQHLEEVLLGPSRISSQGHGPSLRFKEAIGYLQHGRLKRHFFVIHFAVCAIMFNKDTFHSDIQVGSVYVHDVRKSPSNHEGQAGWVLEAVISRSIPIEESRLKGNLISP